MIEQGKNINRFRVILLVISATLLLAAIIVGVILPLTVKAQERGAYLRLSPQAGTFFVGNTFDVSVIVNTNENRINAVKVDLKFPPDKLQVVSPVSGKSFISSWAASPTYSNTEGIISFNGGVPSPGISTSAGLVSTITFRVKAPGAAKIYFLDSSMVLLDDGKGTNILKSFDKGEYTLIVAPPEGPKIFSSTHPEQDTWYKDSNPALEWEKEEGVTDFSYTIDDDFQGMPDNISEGKGDSVSYADLKDEIWYFHIKAKKGEAWGGISNYSIMIDATPPAAFTLNFESGLASIISTQQPIVSFITTDALSGIDHYELKTISLSKAKTEGEEFFIEAASPYRLSLGSGAYKVVVRAYDKAGNWRDSTESVKIIPRGKFVITREGVNFWFVFLHWWLIIIILGVLILIIIIIIILCRRYHVKIYRERGKIQETKQKAEDHKNDINQKINQGSI